MGSYGRVRPPRAVRDTDRRDTAAVEGWTRPSGGINSACGEITAPRAEITESLAGDMVVASLRHKNPGKKRNWPGWGSSDTYLRTRTSGRQLITRYAAVALAAGTKPLMYRTAPP